MYRFVSTYLQLLVVATTLSAVRCAPVESISPQEYASLEQKHQELTQGMREGDENVLNIKTFGAVGDGLHNDTDAFLKAMLYASVFKPWTVLIPEGTFLISPVIFPCRNTRLAIRGTVVAPEAPSGWEKKNYYWKVIGANNCTITGYTTPYDDLGVISGQGHLWWDKRKSGAVFPSLLVFSGLDRYYEDSGVYNISLVNAPGTFISVEHTSWYMGPEVVGVDIYAPETSGTVGVQAINASVRISQSKISTGADNVRLMCGRGESNRVFAGGDYNEFGHGDGISVIMYDGIMGNITFYQSTFRGTKYALRVLGAVDGTGYIQNVGVESSTMDDVGTPIVVDNTGCPEGGPDCKGQSKGVKIDYINMYDVTAFQTSGTAGEFNCRKDQPCSVSLSQVSVKPSAGAISDHWRCANVKGWADDVSPVPDCLTPEK